METLVCAKCKKRKPIDEYFKDRYRPLGIRSRCKKCCAEDTKNWRLKHRSKYNNYAAQWRAKNPDRQHATDIKRHYGITIDEYNKILVAQNHRCAICPAIHNTAVKRGRLYVDHIKGTKIVRGLLCGACNSGIGYLKHDISIIENAIVYLKGSK